MYILDMFILLYCYTQISSVTNKISLNVLLTSTNVYRNNGFNIILPQALEHCENTKLL